MIMMTTRIIYQLYSKKSSYYKWEDEEEKKMKAKHIKEKKKTENREG